MTKTQQCVKSAVASGFRVTRDGKHVFGASGIELKQRLSGRENRQYYTVNVHVPGSKKKKMPVHVHRIVAYLKFGEDVLTSLCVRHLNDDPLDNSWDNIALGTPKENAMDRSPEDRRRHAQKAGKANSLPDETWDKVRADHEAGMGYKKLRAKYGIPLGTLSYRLSKKAKRTAME